MTIRSFHRVLFAGLLCCATACSNPDGGAPASTEEPAPPQQIKEVQENQSSPEAEPDAPEPQDAGGGGHDGCCHGSLPQLEIDFVIQDLPQPPQALQYTDALLVLEGADPHKTTHTEWVISATMPDMDHGILEYSTKPQDEDTFVIQDMYFSMPGTWELTLEVYDLEDDTLLDASKMTVVVQGDNT